MEDGKILEIIANRVNDIRDDVGELKVTMARNTASLEEHMRRTELLEKQVEPLRTHVTVVNGILKAIGGLAVLLGVVEAVIHLLSKA